MKGETVILEIHKSELSFLRKMGSGIFEEAEVVRAILFASIRWDICKRRACKEGLCKSGDLSAER